MENPSPLKLNRRVNFEFAFNNADFSDRVLHLEINSDSGVLVELKPLHISSVLLAANSPFFHKLFDNGMKESKQRDATLSINASEEAGVMEVLNFIYSNTLKSTTVPDLLGVLVVADKFEVTDCASYCCVCLKKKPMSLESALLYLDLPASVLVSEFVQPLIDAAKKCLLSHFKDFKKTQEEALTLPLSAVEVLLGSGNLLVDLSGNDVFEFILKYARAQYTEPSKCHEILTKNLTQLIPFGHMSSLKLKEALVCSDLDHEVVSKRMVEAFIMSAEERFGKSIQEYNKYPVIQVEQYGTPRPRCVVYFDLQKEDCRDLFPSSILYSQSFCLGGRSFYLLAQCTTKAQRHSFDLYLYMTIGSQSCTVDFEFEAINKSSMKFQNKAKVMDHKLYYLPMTRGLFDLFSIPWSDFMSKDSEYFIDGILHLRVDLTIQNFEA